MEARGRKGKIEGMYQPNISRSSKTLIRDLMGSVPSSGDYGDSYPGPEENTCYVSDFGRFAAIFAALNINILSVSYEPAPHPRRLYTTDTPTTMTSNDLAASRLKERHSFTLPDSSDESSERLYLDSASSHITFLIEFKARVTAPDYSSQLRWVKFPVTAAMEDLTDTPEFVYGQIIDQVLQARVALQTPSYWASLTSIERGE